MISILQMTASLKQQKGATMITTLVFLLLMTIVTVSASKMSILDMLVSSNNQRQIEIFQQTENDLKLLTTPIKFFTAYSANQHGVAWEHDFPISSAKPNTNEKIESRDLRYICGGFNGLAVSMGPNTSECYLYDFSVKARAPNTGVRDNHFRGAGKEFPNPTRNNAIRN